MKFTKNVEKKKKKKYFMKKLFKNYLKKKWKH